MKSKIEFLIENFGSSQTERISIFDCLKSIFLVNHFRKKS